MDRGRLKDAVKAAAENLRIGTALAADKALAEGLLAQARRHLTEHEARTAGKINTEHNTRRGEEIRATIAEHEAKLAEIDARLEVLL